MDMVIYFSFGILNVVIYFLFLKTYKKKTGIDLDSNDKFDICMNIIAFIFTGPFGTMILAILGLFLYGMWRKHYRKK